VVATQALIQLRRLYRTIAELEQMMIAPPTAAGEEPRLSMFDNLKVRCGGDCFEADAVHSRPP
jgi:hypothetical protein